MIIIAILGTLLILSTIACINMFVKLARLEKWAEDVRKEMKKVQGTLETLDDKQMFEMDDEVGKLWEQIKDTVDKIDTFVLTDLTSEDNEEEELIEE